MQNTKDLFQFAFVLLGNCGAELFSVHVTVIFKKEFLKYVFCKFCDVAEMVIVHKPINLVKNFY